MAELAVVVVARESEQRNVLQLLVEGTRVARAAQSFGSIPLASTDPVVRRIRDEHPDVVLLDIPSSDPTSAVRAIEVLRQELPQTALFAIGIMTQPHVIVAALRSRPPQSLDSPTPPATLFQPLPL